MSRHLPTHALTRTLIALLVAAIAIMPAGAPVNAARDSANACEADGTQASGAKYRICMPVFGWNGDLVVYAHGYVDPTQPIAIPEDQLNLNGTNVPNAINQLGYGFAMSSYSVNGLAVREGISDTIDLVRIFKEKYPTVKKVYLIGVSEGSLVATLIAERAPQSFSGALALCGPIGDFNTQISHFGDFRVAFDYFFPGVMPASAVNIPPTLLNTWNSSYFSATVIPAITAPGAAISMTQLFSVTGVPIDSARPMTSMIASTAQLLWYNIFSTNDGVQKLGGSPYGNTGKIYSGTLNDSAFNTGVARFSAAPTATLNLGALQTSGTPQIPLVTLHTTGDDVVPYRHAPLYQNKISAQGYGPRYDHQSSPSHGHCAFSVAEVQGALTLLQQRVASPPPFTPRRPVVLPMMIKA
jgi:pimeloyl-ACP methyl ester carboxylesterase